MDAAITSKTPLERYLESLPEDGDQAFSLWLTRERRVAGRFLGSSLSSAFQPIRRLDNCSLFGHEAFIRSFDEGGSELSPWNLFANAASDSSLIELDRLCRTLHVLNYFGRQGQEGPLFLNVHGRLMLAVGEDHGTAFGRVLTALAIERRNIVIESPESMADDLPLLAYVMLNYRYNGYRIGVNLPSLELLPTLLRHVRPDFIKLDAHRDETARHLEGAADRCARHGVTLVLKRLATAELYSRARAVGVPLAQGHLLGHPVPGFL